jgi:2-amino-4-hydroxy-6-hydroxymethyldihydropteridine diphosphokinase
LRHTAYIALGSNLPSWAGPPEETLSGALSRIAKLGRVTQRSSLYSTEPVGFTDQPRFVNAVVALETEMGARELLPALLKIEKEFGRDRSASVPNGPRTLDLDILLMDDMQVSEPGLVLPHPRLAERAFVLIPLFEIAPHLTITGRSQTVAQLLQALRKTHEGETDAVVRMESDRWSAATIE